MNPSQEKWTTHSAEEPYPILLQSLLLPLLPLLLLPRSAEEVDEEAEGPSKTPPRTPDDIAPKG